jgi:DNA polymerase III alpha subunit (gram-positive type)
MTTYYSVDVETTGPIAGIHDLLSVGAVALSEDGTIIDKWHGVLDIADDNLIWDESTRDWWSSQDAVVYEMARNNGEPADVLAAFFVDWVNDSPDPCFVANPVGFDWPFICYWLYTSEMKNPFGHRPLCLRSMHFGLRKVEWGGERESWGEFSIPSKIPHYALEDAIAQAEELRLMLKARNV